jgi:hypothetical protein
MSKTGFPEFGRERLNNAVSVVGLSRGLVQEGMSYVKQNKYKYIYIVIKLSLYMKILYFRSIRLFRHWAKSSGSKKKGSFYRFADLPVRDSVGHNRRFRSFSLWRHS